MINQILKYKSHCKTYLLKFQMTKNLTKTSKSWNHVTEKISTFQCCKGSSAREDRRFQDYFISQTTWGLQETASNWGIHKSVIFMFSYFFSTYICSLTEQNNIGTVPHYIQLRYILYYMKDICIQSYSSPHFPEFGLNTERNGIFSPNAGKYGPE